MSKRIKTGVRFSRGIVLSLAAAAGAVFSIFIAMLSASALLAQASVSSQKVTSSQPRFEAADVHLSPSARNPYNYASGGVLRGERYDLRKATMLDLIKTAWNVDADTVFGGPNWLELDRFDIYAKAPLDTPPETVRLMLQALLRDRFGLVIHEETRPLPTFALTVGQNKPKLTESNGSTVPECEYQPAISGFQVYGCRNITMDAFVQRLRQIAPDYLAEVDGIVAHLVHSMDAAHMMRTIIRLYAEGIRHFAMVHDSYGVQACDVELLNRVLREEFVGIYSEPVLQNFLDQQRKAHPGISLPDPPQTGDLDIQQVLSSPYFFV